MKNDKKSAILILVLTAVMVYFTLQLPKSTMEGEPGPAFFPMILFGLMAGCSVVLLFSKPKKKVPEISEEELKKYEELGMEIEDEEEDSKQLSLKEGLILFGLFLIGIILMYFLGYIVGITVGIASMLIYIGWKVPKAVIFSLITAACIFLLFNVLLQVPLPSGKLL